MYLATIKYRFSKIDQCNLVEKINAWKKEAPQDKFYFRPYGESSVDASRADDACLSDDDENIKITSSGNAQKLLFIHQTDQQRRLLKRYGNEICLLDATYKTTKYALPLFFVVVKTNVDYQIVASFVVQDESTKSITEALAILKSWNPFWDAKCFMVDNCEEEIQSIEANFSGKFLLFHQFSKQLHLNRNNHLL